MRRQLRPRCAAPAGQTLTGSGDISAFADPGGSFAIVAGMRRAPFTGSTALQLVVITLLPVAPLLLTLFSSEELLTTLRQAVFWLRTPL